MFERNNDAFTWSTRTFINNDGNVSIIYLSGVEDNTAINLSANIIIDQSIQVGNTKLSPGGLFNTDIINITSDMDVVINGNITSNAGDLAITGDFAVAGIIDYFPIPKGWYYFVDILTGLTSNITINAKSSIINNVTGTNGIGLLATTPPNFRQSV